MSEGSFNLPWHSMEAHPDLALTAWSCPATGDNQPASSCRCLGCEVAGSESIARTAFPCSLRSGLIPSLPGSAGRTERRRSQGARSSEPCPAVSEGIAAVNLKLQPTEVQVGDHRLMETVNTRRASGCSDHSVPMVVLPDMDSIRKPATPLRPPILRPPGTSLLDPRNSLTYRHSVSAALRVRSPRRSA
jgi:hypothetical protein